MKAACTGLSLWLFVLPLAVAPMPAVARHGAEASASSSALDRQGELPIDEAQEARLLRIAGDGFRIRRTAHFVIAYNVPYPVVVSLSGRLERTYRSVTGFCERSGFSIEPLSRRLEVIFFDKWAEYARYGRRADFDPAGSYGFYHGLTNRSAFFNVENAPELIRLQASIQAARDSADRMEDAVKSMPGNLPVNVVFSDGRRVRMSKAQAAEQIESTRRDLRTLDKQRENYSERINRTVVQHEVAHQVLYNNGVHVRGAINPRWLVEGLACMFETPPGPGGGGLGAVNQDRLRDFREIVLGDTGRSVINVDLYLKAVAAGRMTSVEDLVRRPELFMNLREGGANHYAATWALLHYLHRVHNSSLSDYLRAVATRRPGQRFTPEEEWQLFEQHFGPVDDNFLRRFSGYILRLPCRASGDLE